MGFIQAVKDLGALDMGTGLQPYLKFPLERGGVVMRVYMDIEDIEAYQLIIKGISRIDATEFSCGPEMKYKYLFRERVGGNVSWSFSPVYRVGKPGTNRRQYRLDWVGAKGDWQDNKNSHLCKIRKRLLDDYEKEQIINSGAADMIILQLESLLPVIFKLLQPGKPHIMVFGAERAGAFIYPGEMPALLRYFENKLQLSLMFSEKEQACALCGTNSVCTPLARVFKFATVDKVSFLPGLDKRLKNNAYSVCRQCMGHLSSGREKVERVFSDNGIIPGIQMWIIPEALTAEGGKQVEKLLHRLGKQGFSVIAPEAEKREIGIFQQLSGNDESLVFHFIFWERNNAQELLHLMLESVSPVRLAFLESCWNTVLDKFMEKESKIKSLDLAFRSLYYTLGKLAGKNEADRLVFRNFCLYIMGRMLVGASLPVQAFKKNLISRCNRLINETENFSEMRTVLFFIMLWGEYMHLINGSDNMKPAIFEEFNDPYLRQTQGQGVFLASIVLGYIARNQVAPEQDIKNSPIFKQIQFGRMSMKKLKRLMLRVPEIVAAEQDHIPANQFLFRIYNEANRHLLEGDGQDLGLDGNYVFTVGFGNAALYFWKLFRSREMEG